MFCSIKDKYKYVDQMRRLCNMVSKMSNASSTTIANVKSFDTIPGPKGIFGLGTLYQYWPTVGIYDWNEIHKAGFEKHQKWGSIVKERMVPGVDVVWLFDPHDISKVLNNAGPGMYPQRKSHLGLEKYRKDRPHIYKTGGLLPTNGDEWWRLRSELQKGLSSPTHVKQFLTQTDEITKEFISYIKPVQSNDAVPDFLPELARLNLELVCLLAFDVRMNSFSEDERSDFSKSTRLIDAAEISNSCILPLDQGLPFWRLFETPVYKKLRVSQEFIESVAIDLVNQKISYYDEKPSKDSAELKAYTSLLEDYLQNPNLDLADIVGMACDLLLAGIDTTTYSSCFLLYHIARDPDVQKRLYEEACSIIPDYENSSISVESLQNRTPYTRAVLKELFRINPVSVGVGRTTNSDLVLSGYNVPKGTITVTQNFVACRLDKNFESPEKFIPDRWLKTSTNASKSAVNPYLVLPFGHGMRACIARRFAEQNMLVLMIRLIRKYEIGWAGFDYLDVKTTTTINKPDQPTKITFKERLA